MKKESYLVGYMGIAVFIILIFIPPLLRFAIPKQEIVIANDVILSCTKFETIDKVEVKMTVINKYTNDQLKLLKFNYFVTIPEKYEIPNDFTTKSLLSKEYDSLRAIENVKFTQNDSNSSSLSFDYDKFKFNSELIKKYVSETSADKQKEKNITDGFESCVINR